MIYALPVLKAVLIPLADRPQPFPLLVVITDSLLASLMCAGWIYAIVLMRGHSRLFPRTYISLHIAQLLVVAIQLAEKWRARLDAGHNVAFLGKATATAILWISYIYFSKRVKVTFVK